MNVFDIIGPVMVGPSSSHTAGAVRIGRFTRAFLGEEPVEAEIRLHGSFARTYKGHGTDRALIGGLLGFDKDDLRLKDSLKYAREKGMTYSVIPVELNDVHPNTAMLQVKGAGGKMVSVLGYSVGGGNILIKEINGIKVEVTGEYHTLVIVHRDTPGIVAKVTGILAGYGINIAGMNLYRLVREGEAFMFIETDQGIQSQVITEISALANVSDVVFLEPN